MKNLEISPTTQELRLEPHIEQSNYTPDSYDRTVDGVVELMSSIELTMQAVRSDWRTTVDRGGLEVLAAPHVERLNAERAAFGGQPLAMADISNQFLLGMAEPDWEASMPTTTDDKDQVARWEELKAEYPDLAPNLEDWYMYHSKLHELRQDSELMARVDNEWRGEQMAATRAAHEFLQLERRREDIGEQMAEIRARAAKTGRRLTPGEQGRLRNLQEQLANAEADVNLLGETDKEVYLNEVDRLKRLEDRRQLKDGLLMTDQMRQVIKESVPALMAGNPALFVGGTGGAKTLLAMHISRHYFGVEPEFVRGHADLTAADLIGRAKLREQNGATVTEFGHGPVARAAEQGRPLIIDEANAILSETLKSLNPIMQIRPGQKLILHEDSVREIIVKSGFCVILTANEKSKRYKGVDDFSVDFQNRVSANIYRIHYPDHNNAYTDDPIENERLAFARICTERGEFPDNIDPDDFDNLVRAAFVSQQIFDGTHGEGYNDYIPRDKQVDGKPGLEETIIASRTLDDILKKVAGSYGEVSIKRACQRFLDGIKNESDRKVMHLLLGQHNLLPDEVGK